jgi:uncharacterized membrane protein
LVSGPRAIALLALIGMSLVLFGTQLGGDWVAGFAQKNWLDIVARQHLLNSMIATGASIGAIGVTVTWLGGRNATTTMAILARLLAPLSLLGCLPTLFAAREAWEAWESAIAIACLVVLFEMLARTSIEAYDELLGRTEAVEQPVTRRQRRIGVAIVCAAALFYGLYMSKYTLYAHWRFQTYGYDLGQYDNVFANAFHGRPLRCTPLGCFKNWSSISGHADLSVFFLLPFYAIYPHAEALLVMQSFILGLGAIPLYFFAVRRIRPSYACALAICYLLFPPMHGANFYDFHMQPIASTFVLLTICFLDARRWFWCALSFIVAITCREDISVGLTMLGLYLLLSGYRPRAGVVMALSGTAYFVVMRFVIMPAFGGSWFQEIYKDLYPQPNGPHSFGGVILTLATNPVYVLKSVFTQDKLRYFLQIVVPVAFLPLRRTYLLPALVPGTLFTLLTTAYSPTTDIGFQYSGHFTPYLFTATALALAAYRSEPGSTIKSRAAALALVVGTVTCTIFWGAFPVPGKFKGGFSLINFTAPTAANAQKQRDLMDLSAMIPDQASVAVSEEELPHVSGRYDVRTLRDGTGSADYLLYGTSSAGASVAQKALTDGEYLEIATRPGLALLKRKGL